MLNLPMRSEMYPTNGHMAATAKVFAVNSQFGIVVPISAAMYDSEGLTKYRIAWAPCRSHIVSFDPCN